MLKLLTVKYQSLLHCRKYPLILFLIACTSHCKDYVPLAASAEEHLNLAEIVFNIDFSKLGTRCGAFQESVRAVAFSAMSFKLPVLRLFFT